MQTAKDHIKYIVDLQPNDSSYDEILKELAFARMVERGLNDVKKENVISNKEMGKRINQWLK